jgi:hypothetical protein
MSLAQKCTVLIWRSHVSPGECVAIKGRATDEALALIHEPV